MLHRRLKIPRAASKTWSKQINKLNKYFKKYHISFQTLDSLEHRFMFTKEGWGSIKSFPGEAQSLRASL